MACSHHFSSQGTYDAASTPASTSSAGTGSGSANLFTGASFSVFQEGPGQPLVFAPPLHTPELQALVDRFLALDVPALMKMDMIRCDFEAHVARTNERYKTYFVPSAASPPPPPALPATTVAAAGPSPSLFTASPVSLFPSTLNESAASASSSQATALSSSSASGASSCSRSFFFDAPPADSPALPVLDHNAAVTTADASVFPLQVPMFPSLADYSAFYGEAATNDFFLCPPTSVAATPPATAVTLAPTPGSTSASSTPLSRAAPRPSRSGRTQRRYLTEESMQILTLTGENITHVSSRATRTNEDRENTRLVRQRGACPDCRRKKQRCSPGHAGSMLDRVAPHPAPYAAPAQSGRDKQEATGARIAQAAKDKVEGKKPAAAEAQAPVFETSWAGLGLPGASPGARNPGVSPGQADALSLFGNWFDLGEASTNDLLLSDLLDTELALANSSASAPETALAGARASTTPAPSQTFSYGIQQLQTYSPRKAARPQQLHPRAINAPANAVASSSSHSSHSQLDVSRSRERDSSLREQHASRISTGVERHVGAVVPDVGTSASAAGVRAQTGVQGVQDVQEGGRLCVHVHTAPADRARHAAPADRARTESDAAAVQLENPAVANSTAAAEGRTSNSGVLPTVVERNSGVSTPEAGVPENASDVDSANVKPSVLSDVCSSDGSSPGASSSELCGSDGQADEQRDVQPSAADVLFGLTAMAAVAASLLPALAAWSAVHVPQAAVADLGDELERMHLGVVSPVACQ